MTKRFIGDDLGQIKALETVDIQWLSDKLTGRLFMQEVEGSIRTWDADLVLLAMGYVAPLTQMLVNELDVKLDHRGNLATDATTKMTNIEGIFAAGDCRRGQSPLGQRRRKRHGGMCR